LLDKLSASAKRKYVQQPSAVEEVALLTNGGNAVLDTAPPIQSAAACREEYEERKSAAAPSSRQSSSQRGSKRMRIQEVQSPWLPAHAFEVNDGGEAISPATETVTAAASGAAAFATTGMSSNGEAEPLEESFGCTQEESAELARLRAQLQARSQQFQAKAQLRSRLRQTIEENRKLAEAKAASDEKLEEVKRQLAQLEQ
jgi:hypothetical protein